MDTENKSTSRMETAVASLIGKDAEQARKDMSLACNTFCLDIKGFLELIRQNAKAAKVWTAICWYWVSSLSRRYGKDNYDLRNKQSCYTGNLIQQALDDRFEPLPDLARDDFITIFIGSMAYDHKTLQQMFSSLVFAWLDYLAEEKGVRKAKHAVKPVKAVEYGRWYNMPMI